jgi:hypothetical protein
MFWREIVCSDCRGEGEPYRSGDLPVEEEVGIIAVVVDVDGIPSCSFSRG